METHILNVGGGNRHDIPIVRAQKKNRQCFSDGAEQRQATHEHVSKCRHACVRVNGNLRPERWRRQAPWHFMHAHKQSLVPGVAEVCMWLGPSHRQAKDNEKKLWS